jgi:hypothetical protein
MQAVVPYVEGLVHHKIVIHKSCSILPKDSSHKSERIRMYYCEHRHHHHSIITYVFQYC